MGLLQLGLLLCTPCAVDSILAQFEHTPLVAFAEHHRNRQEHAFLLELLAHPEFPRKVQDIVVEFGSAHYQPVVDRYVRGEAVPRAELEWVWRGAGQWLVWDSPVYQRLLTAVRARNALLPPGKGIRVLLGDPPIHWPAVTTAAAYQRFAERDSHYAEVVEREVLARGRHALLIMGGVHFQRRGALDSPHPSLRPGVGEILTGRHPGALFVVWAMPASPALARELGIDSAATFRRVRGSDLERRSFAKMIPPGIQVQRVIAGDTVWVPLGEVPWPPMVEVIDALLYVGPDSSTVDPDPGIYREPVYQSELRRRAAILKEVYGLDFLSELEDLLRREPPH